MAKINKTTLLGIACARCGAVTSDEKVLGRAVFRSWTCPSCGARNLSRNDAMAAAKVIVSEDEAPTLQADAEEDESCKVGHMDPEKLRRICEEFKKRTSL